VSEETRVSDLLVEALRAAPNANSQVGCLAQEELNKALFTGDLVHMLQTVFSCYYRAENEVYGKKIPENHDCKPLYASEDGLSIGESFKCSTCDKIWRKTKTWNSDRSYDIWWLEVKE